MARSQVIDDTTFKAELVLLIPHFRAFARSLAGRAGADDLAQEAMMKAWKSRAQYQPGTNLKAWVFTILRNEFLSNKRRDWRTQPLEPEVAENTLVANDDPSTREELLDLRNAMKLLPDAQREALVLVGAAGLSYEETARICGCEIGTVKSRVNRGRAALADILETRRDKPRARTGVSAAQAFEEIMRDAAGVHRRLEPTHGFAA